jgi:hypothetical protein
MKKATVTAEEKQPCFINDTPFNLATLRKANGHLKTVAVLCFVMLGITILAIQFIPPARTMLIFCAGVYIFIGLINLFGYINIKRNAQVREDAHHLYRFYEDEVYCVGLHGEEKRGEFRLEYGQLTKVAKMNGFLLLRFGTVAWLVAPNGFSQGSEEELVDFLREKCNPKVVKIKKK